VNKVKKTNFFKPLLIVFLLYPITLSAQCGISVDKPMNFGLFNPIESEIKSSVVFLKVSCSGEDISNYKIIFSRGKGRSISPRYMLGKSNKLGYNLYIDAARTIIWGNGRNGSSPLYGTGPCTELKPCTHVVYGKLTGSNAKLNAGEYQDTVRILLQYE